MAIGTYRGWSDRSTWEAAMQFNEAAEIYDRWGIDLVRTSPATALADMSADLREDYVEGLLYDMPDSANAISLARQHADCVSFQEIAEHFIDRALCEQELEEIE